MTISLIVAVDENNGIGKDNQLPWHLPADLKHFKTLTTGHPILMGRKTFESIGKALPNRRNIVISRQEGYTAEGADAVSSLQEAFLLCEGEEEVFIIGGAQIFEHSLSLADVIYLTVIHHRFDADTFFPKIDKKAWKEVESSSHQPDEKNKYSYTFIKYSKA
ncbi:dihydrofolate reductase [Daejeonella sp. JGW-45]|uniref:dihydrofolate reductase n=1 Tax=Daejeonella sp. JGW-45 TaxID=3034148 RepID=UPI0023EB0B63|nr:dihydrofolate reductase [Daejeonella sp. JGW-45]